MAAFRRLLFALFAVALLVSLSVPAANADPFTCNGNAGSPFLIRSESISELVGDIVMNCTGGTPTAPGTPIPVSIVTIFLSAPNLTSRLYANGLSEVVLTIDEPFPLGTQVPANATPGQTAATAPLGCQAINTTNCAITGNGGGIGAAGPYNGSAGHYNVFQGFQNGANSVAFNGVPIDGPGGFGTRVIRISNIRADATAVGLAAVPLPVTATITVNGSQQIIVNNPTPTVANVVQGLIASNTAATYTQCLNINGPLLGGTDAGGAQDGFVTVNVTEGFAASFKERNYAQRADGIIVAPLPPSTVGYQNVLGFPYSTESGFVSATPGLSNPGLGNGSIGLADTGTQFQAAITNIGAGVHIFAPNKVLMSNVASNLYTGTACLVGSNCTGTETEIAVSAGVAIATYEVWLSDPNVTETAAIAFQVAAISNTGAGQPGVGVSQVTASFAPISPVHLASTSAPTPRFVIGTSTPQTAFSITSCMPPVPGDFNGDSTPDLVLQNKATQQVTVWYMGGAMGNTFLGWNWLDAAGHAGWTVVAAADLNQDGHTDLILQNSSSRRVVVWYMGGATGNTFLGWKWLDAAGQLGWSVVASSDVNQDGHPDLIWQNDTTRQVSVWYMGGALGNTVLGWNWLDAAGQPGWSVVAAADVNQDGHTDLVWQNNNTRQVVVWYLGGATGNTFLGWNWLDAAGHPGWSVIAIGDLNQDGHPDLIWQNNSTLQVVVWYMGGAMGNTFLGWNWLDAKGHPGWKVVGL